MDDGRAPSATEELKPCRECGAPCRLEYFPNPDDRQPDTVLWLCSKHTMFGGKCPSDTAYLTKEAWNTRTDQPPPHTGLTEAVEALRAELTRERQLRMELQSQIAETPHTRLIDVARRTAIMAEARKMWVLAAATLERDVLLHGLIDDEQDVMIGAVLNAAERYPAMQQPVHAEDTDEILRAYENDEADAAMTIEALVELADKQAALLVSNRSGVERQDFSRTTLRHNIETILRQWRDAHPNTLLDKIMSAIPRVSNRSGVERQDFSRTTLRHNIETILRQWRDAHPNTLLDKIMSAIPRVSNRSGVEDLKHDLDRYMKIANIECNEAERFRELLSCALDEYETHNGRVLKGNHWSIEARTALDTENSEDHMSREG